MVKRITGFNTYRIALAAVLCCGLFVHSQTANSFDWFQTGKNLINKSTTEQVPSLATLTDTEIGAGLKDALKVGTERVVGQLGAMDGFNSDSQIHIPLPDNFSKVRSILATVGKTALLDDLELKLNRAAEQATPQAKKLFWDSIKEMTVADVKKIYNGPEDAATRYFQSKMGQPLSTAMQPIVDASMAQVGAVQAYNNVMGQYTAIPFVPDIKANLTSYVVEKGMDGIFFYLAKEEAAIRQNPVKRTTEILQKVFGTK